MENLMQKYQKVTTEKHQHDFNQTNKVILSTAEIRKFLKNCKGLSKVDSIYLKNFLESCKLQDGGHDITEVKTWVNRYTAENIGYGEKKIKEAKESGQARGIFLIDGLYWDEYRTEKNGKLVRLRTAYSQSIQLSPEFINFMVEKLNDKNIMIDDSFNYHPDYAKKIEESYLAAKHRSLKHMIKKVQNLIAETKGNVDKVVDNLLNSCEKVGVKCLPTNSDQVGIKRPRLLNQESEFSLNKTNLNTNSDGCLKVKNDNLNLIQNLGNTVNNMIASTHREMRKWQDATTKFCDSLIKAGKTYHEVGLLMVQQRYVRSMVEFKRVYSPPIE